MTSPLRFNPATVTLSGYEGRLQARTPAFALNTDEISALLPRVPLWKLGDGGRSLQRRFVFEVSERSNGDLQLGSFLAQVQVIGHAFNHHAAGQFVFNGVTLTLNTYDSGALVTLSDFILATAIDDVVARLVAAGSHV